MSCDQGDHHHHDAWLWSLNDWDDTKPLQKTRLTKYQVGVPVVPLMVNAINRSRMIKPVTTMLCLLGGHLAQAHYATIPLPCGLCDVFGYSRFHRPPFEKREACTGISSNNTVTGVNGNKAPPV
jgi:hypothetical protein